MANCITIFDKQTSTWHSIATLDGKVIAYTQAWSKEGVVTQLTKMIKEKT